MNSANKQDEVKTFILITGTWLEESKTGELLVGYRIKFSGQDAQEFVTPRMSNLGKMLEKEINDAKTN